MKRAKNDLSITPKKQTIEITEHLFKEYIMDSEMDGMKLPEPIINMLGFVDVFEEMRIKTKYGDRVYKTKFPPGTTTRSSISVMSLARIYEPILQSNKEKHPDNVLKALAEYDKKNNLGNFWFFNMVLDEKKFPENPYISTKISFMAKVSKFLSNIFSRCNRQFQKSA